MNLNFLLAKVFFLKKMEFSVLLFFWGNSFWWNTEKFCVFFRIEWRKFFWWLCIMRKMFWCLELRVELVALVAVCGFLGWIQSWFNRNLSCKELWKNPPKTVSIFSKDPRLSYALLTPLTANQRYTPSLFYFTMKKTFLNSVTFPHLAKMKNSLSKA